MIIEVSKNAVSDPVPVVVDTNTTETPEKKTESKTVINKESKVPSKKTPKVSEAPVKNVGSRIVVIEKTNEQKPLKKVESPGLLNEPSKNDNTGIGNVAVQKLQKETTPETHSTKHSVTATVSQKSSKKE